jgi:aldehyde dehydrogenase (NAD+)
MTIAEEEIFGPVMSILKFSTDAEVVERANNTRYGLAAGICSKNIGRALGMANQLRAGSVWVNTYDNFDPAAPFGGYGESGIGRDKGEDGLEAWTETKCVVVPLDGPKC